MQDTGDEPSSRIYRAVAAAVCVVTLVFALYAGALGGLWHAASFTADRAGDVIDRPHPTPVVSPAEPMWLTVPCRRMLIWPARLDQLVFCARQPQYG